MAQVAVQNGLLREEGLFHSCLVLYHKQYSVPQLLLLPILQLRQMPRSQCLQVHVLVRKVILAFFNVMLLPSLYNVCSDLCCCDAQCFLTFDHKIS